MIQFVSGHGDTYLREITPKYHIYFSTHWECIGEINFKIATLNSRLSAERIGIKEGREGEVVAFAFRYTNLISKDETLFSSEAFFCELHATGAVVFASEWGTLVQYKRNPYFLLDSIPPRPTTAVGKQIVLYLCDSVVTESSYRGGWKCEYTRHFYDGSAPKVISREEASQLSVRRYKNEDRVLEY